MSERLDDALASAVEKLVDGVGAGAGFLAGELPDYVMQLLMWKAVESAVVFVFWVCVFGLLVVLTIKLRRFLKTDAEKRLQLDVEIVLGGAILVTLFLLVLGFVYSSLDWLQILIAPKVYLVEYVAGLAK